MFPKLLNVFGGRRESASEARATPTLRSLEARAPACAASAEDVSAAGRPNLRTFDADDGIPQSSILDVTFDLNGYLWVGTEDGAARYDGRSWKVLAMPRRTISNFVRQVYASPSGDIWFGTHGAGLNRFRNGAWEVWDTDSGLPDNIVISVREGCGADGWRRLYAGTRSGLAERSRGRWIVHDVRAGLPHDVVVCLHETADSQGVRELWAGTRGGLGRLQNGEWTNVSAGAGLPDESILSICETAANDGRQLIWLGTARGGLARYDGKSWRVLNAEAGLPDDRVFCVRASNDRRYGGSVWVGTLRGVVRVGEDMGVVERITSLAIPSVLSLCVTPPQFGAECLWIGTDGGGLVRKGPERWLRYSTDSVLPDSSVTAFAETRTTQGDREFWVGCESGLVRFRSGAWQTIGGPGGEPHSFVRCMLGDPTGSTGLLWLGETRRGVLRWDGTEWSRLTTDDGLPSNSVNCIIAAASADGDVWFGTDAGVARLSGSTWRYHTTETGLPHHFVFCLAETRDADGAYSLWVGTNGGGLARLRGGRWTVFDVASGFPTNVVMSLCEVHGDRGRRSLWVGTQSAGVVLVDLDDERAPFEVLSDETDPRLPNNTVNQIQVDGRGRVYLFTNKGVARLTRQGGALTLYTFTTEDGLPSNEANSGAAYVDLDGRIWAGTVAGAGMLDPAVEIEDTTPKPLHISVAAAGQARTRLEAGASLSHDENNLTFEYDLLSYFREADTAYRTQLVGFDRGPSEWTREWKRTYTNLPAGRYTFKVWGQDYAGNVTDPETVPFAIRPAPWRTWWAYVGYAGIAAGAAYGGVRWRVNTLRRRTEMLERTVARQTAELAAKVDLLRHSESVTREKAEQLARVVDQLRVAEANAQRAKAEAITAKDKAIEASHAKSVFLSNMSHELRTPLNAVLGFAQLMDRDTSLSADQRDHLTAIMSSGEHLLHLINDVLSLSKIEAGKLTLTVQPFDLHRTLDGVEAMLRGRTRGKGLRLLVERSEDLPRWVCGDEGKLRQVLINLLGNAVKFTAVGGITMRARWRAGIAEFEVKDTGFGIGPDELETLFEPFVQTESGRNSKEGTGLGLAISRNFVQMMGGDIHVRSVLGKGSIFSFDVELPHVEDGDEHAGRRSVVAIEPGSPEYRILIVDDADRNREILLKLLSSVGFTVAEATNGREAIAVWASWRPHLILMDMRMPQLDGRSATQEIRRLEVSSDASTTSGLSDGVGRPGPGHCVIISLTASAFEHERSEILTAGCDDFLTKPFREDLLFEKLAEHLGVTFRYASDVDRVARQARDRGALSPERLRALPIASLAQLNDAVVKGDVEQANGIVDDISARDPLLAEELRDLIRGYRFDEIQELIERIPQWTEAPGEGRLT